MKSAFLLSTALCLAILSPMAASAASVTFNFNNTTQYPVGSYLQPSQVLTPDIGTGQTAQVGILNAANPNQVFNIIDSTAGGFAPTGTQVYTGQSITDAENTSDVLQLTFGHAIHTITLAFTVLPGANTPPPANTNPLQLSAFLNSSSATPLATALGVGDTYNSTHFDQYFGNLTLTSAVGFSTLDIGLFNPSNTTGDTFSFDDIVADDSPLSTVPEPGAIALALALGLPAAWRLKKSRKSRSK